MGAQAWGRDGWLGLAVARVGFGASALVMLGSLYCWLYFEDDIPNLTLGGMAAQSLVALIAFVAGLGALLRSGRGQAGAVALGVVALVGSAAWLPVILAVWG